MERCAADNIVSQPLQSRFLIVSACWSSSSCTNTHCDPRRFPQDPRSSALIYILRATSSTFRLDFPAGLTISLASLHTSPLNLTSI
jgi:hypothetical protein